MSHLSEEVHRQRSSYDTVTSYRRTSIYWLWTYGEYWDLPWSRPKWSPVWWRLTTGIDCDRGPAWWHLLLYYRHRLWFRKCVKFLCSHSIVL